MLCSSCFFHLPFPFLHPTCTHPHIHTSFTHVHSACCVTPSVLWVWMCLCVRAVRLTLQSKEDTRQFWCIIKLDRWLLWNHPDLQKCTHGWSLSGYALCISSEQTHANEPHTHADTLQLHNKSRLQRRHTNTRCTYFCISCAQSHNCAYFKRTA